jgi:RNA 3'-terminal phosphate cyclase
VGEEAAKKYIGESSCNPGVDSHLADMLATLLPCMKKSGKPSFFTTPEVTQHLNTNIEIVRKFIPECKFDLIAPKGEGNDTSCWKVAVSR